MASQVHENGNIFGLGRLMVCYLRDLYLGMCFVCGVFVWRRFVCEGKEREWRDVRAQKKIGKQCCKFLVILVRSLECVSSGAAAVGTGDYNCGIVGVFLRDKFPARAHAPHKLWNWQRHTQIGSRWFLKYTVKSGAFYDALFLYKS